MQADFWPNVAQLLSDLTGTLFWLSFWRTSPGCCLFTSLAMERQEKETRHSELWNNGDVKKKSLHHFFFKIIFAGIQFLYKCSKLVPTQPDKSHGNLVTVSDHSQPILSLFVSFWQPCHVHANFVFPNHEWMKRLINVSCARERRKDCLRIILSRNIKTLWCLRYVNFSLYGIPGFFFLWPRPEAAAAAGYFSPPLLLTQRVMPTPIISHISHTFPLPPPPSGSSSNSNQSLFQMRQKDKEGEGRGKRISLRRLFFFSVVSGVVLHRWLLFWRKKKSGKTHAVPLKKKQEQTLLQEEAEEEEKEQKEQEQEEQQRQQQRIILFQDLLASPQVKRRKGGNT